MADVTRRPRRRKKPQGRKANLWRIAMETAANFENEMFRDFYLYATEQLLFYDNDVFLQFIGQLKQQPVDIDTFLDSDDFFGSTDLKLWPKVRETIVAINKYWWRGKTRDKGAKTEALLMGACVDAETEFLTPIGWKKISQYEEGDLVGQYHPDGRLSFVEPKAYVKRPWDNFYHFNPRGGLDMVLTPGHRVIAQNRNTGELQEWTAEDVAQKQNTLACGFKGRFLSTFQVEGRPGIPLTEEQLRVMVMVHADGSFYEDTPWCNLILKKSRKIQRARELLEAAGIEYQDNPHDGGKYRRFKFYAPQRNKTYEGWWDCSPEQLQSIADEVMYWDGSHYHDQYYTSKKEEADFIQYALLASGSRATMQQQKREGHSTEYRVERCATATYCMSGPGPKSGQNLSEVSYGPASDGFAYCFTLPTGMWLMRRNGSVVVTGNTGTGKSEIAKVTAAYHLHLLHCLRNPQEIYKLPSSTTIVFMIQAAKPHVTKKIIYLPLRNYIQTMPWFRRNARFEQKVESELYFSESNIRVVPGGSDSDSVLGEAILFAALDEVNFMNVVQKSKKAEAGTGRPGVYDQARNVYDTVTRRREGRFMYPGPQIGCIIASSSTRYVGDFTDKRKEEIDENDEFWCHVYNVAQYEARPADRYCGDMMRIVVENAAAADIRILKPEERAHKTANVIEVPIEYEAYFLRDSAGALRDIVGMSVNALSPFIRRRNKVDDAVVRGIEKGLESILVKDNVNVGLEGLPRVRKGSYCQNPGKPRYVHIDLAVNGDRCGISMVRFDGFTDVTRENGEIETLPMCTVELAVGIQGDHGQEVDIFEVRSWVKALKVKYGYPIRGVTYDGWNSLESRQQWKKERMKTGEQSVDRTVVPYAHFRDAIYDDRLDLINNPDLLDEVYSLEFDDTKNKVDHPPNGSKDIADAVCGAYYTLLQRSETWQGGGSSYDREDDDDRQDLGPRRDSDRPE